MADGLTADLTEHDKPIFNHSLIKAWRYDSNKWRTRGKGSVTMYYNVKINKAKLIFFDEKYQKVRLLQYIDNVCGESTATINTPDSESVDWVGNDYTMDALNPLKSQWKLKFITSANTAIQFSILYNYHISLFNKYLNRNEFLQELNCNICYEFINDAQLLYCGHIGCNKCMTQWITQSSTCPICRIKIDESVSFTSCNTIDIIIKHKTSNKCICKQTIDNNIYVNCYVCDNWYHPQCVGLQPNQINEMPYKCILCKSKQDNNCNVYNNQILIGEVACKSVVYNDKKLVIDTKLQFLQNINNGKYRLIARDEETNEIKIDQFIYDYYRETLEISSDTSYSWHAMDCVLQTEFNIYQQVSFMATFYTEKDALEFKLYYLNNCNNNVLDNESVISDLSKINDEIVEIEMDDIDNKHSDDPIEEWKNASVIAMKENVRIYSTGNTALEINTQYVVRF